MSDTLILVLNCGSSSIKFALFDASVQPIPRQPVWKGKVQGIGGPAPEFDETGVAPFPVMLTSDHPYLDALRVIHERVRARLGERRVACVAHRVVHGGAKYFEPVRMNAEVVADLRSYIPLAPLHQPFAIEAIERLFAMEPTFPQIACFDTAFHCTMPQVEQMLALPWSVWERGVRRYGFHGLSYEYISHALPERYGQRANGRVIVAHLGSGASLCAMQDLRSVATTMGFSALDGLMMGTRCGSLDPGAVIYLMQIWKLSLEEVAHMLYHDSGLYGVSGVSSDPRELLPLEPANERVQAALALYVRRIVGDIGELAAALGGLDMLVFTAGLGEHNDEVRARVCRKLGWLGVALDEAANERHGPVISSAESRVTVGVEKTNEEWIAAWHAARLLAGDGAGTNPPALRADPGG